MTPERAQLAAEHLWIAQWHAAQSSRAVPHLRADWNGAAEEALCRAAASWDGRVPFVTWAHWRVGQALMDEYRRLVSRGGRTRQTWPLLYDPIDPTDDDDPIDWGSAIARLAPGQPKDVAMALLAGDTLTEIGARYGVTVSRASQVWAVARKRLARIVRADLAA